MTALQAYLQNSKTRKALSKKSADSAGFSLIELVVVVAVLAVLAAIAIPAYNNITEKGRTSAAKTAIANAAKECAVSRADLGSASAAHTALVDGSALTYSAGLTGTTCTEALAVVCVDNATRAQYAVALTTCIKVPGATVITAISPCTTTVTTAW